jgi:pyruvate dehydrogenase E2 component (dihydrolipoyllysine-residue acetyltransferase)
MATILSMPKWGLAMKSGLVVEWLKKAGDQVEQGDPLVEIESEKATNEVEAPMTGTVRWIGVEEGDKAPVGTPLAVIASTGEELSDEEVQTLLRADAEEKQKRSAMATKQRPTSSSPSAEPAGSIARSTTSSGGRINASPAARRLAQELGIDLTTINGTGPNGMIGREDVLRASEQVNASQETGEAEEHDIDVGGIKTHYLLAGPSGAPRVVFVHGLGGSIPTWSLNLPSFAEQFRVCALDMVGAGESDKPATDYSAVALANFLENFLDALGPDWHQVSLVGHSLGGAIALSFANRHPERVDKLVLIDSAGLGPEIDNTLLNLVQSEPGIEHISAELALFFTNLDFVQQALVEQLYEQRRQAGAHEALVATQRAAFANGQQLLDLRQALADRSGSTLIIWGAADSVIPVSHAQQIQQNTQSRVEIFTNSGHCPHIEQSDAFNSLVKTFLS